MHWALGGGSQGNALCTGPFGEGHKESLVHWALGRGSQGESLCTGPLVEGPKGRTRHRGTSADRKTSNSIHSGSPRPPIKWGMFSTDKLYP